ncbi:MAG: hypothetical protein GC183_04890 [Thiobacillus sp.]|nr:hypothetical protein [Thiobacillus sp.]
MSDNRGSEIDRARDAWRKKFSVAPANAHERARQIRFLQGRGFSQSVIDRVLTSGETAC